MDPQREWKHCFYLEQPVLTAELGVVGHDPEATEVREMCEKTWSSNVKEEEGGWIESNHCLLNNYVVETNEKYSFPA